MQSAARRTKQPQPLHLGPEDDGRELTWEEYANADFAGGFNYEIIDGRLVVAAMPNLQHDKVWSWLNDAFVTYRLAHPEVIGHQSSNSSVLVPHRPGVTAPQPDFALYQSVPAAEVESGDLDWRAFDPLLVVEIVSPSNSRKDLERNVELYELVPAIREYWIVDPRDGINQRTLTVCRRRGKKWLKPIVLNMGETYTTKLLPGFRLRRDTIA